MLVFEIFIILFVISTLSVSCFYFYKYPHFYYYAITSKLDKLYEFLSSILSFKSNDNKKNKSEGGGENNDTL